MERGVNSAVCIRKDGRGSLPRPLRKEGSVAWVLAGEGWSKYYEVLPRKLEQQDCKQRGALLKTKRAFL